MLCFRNGGPEWLLAADPGRRCGVELWGIHLLEAQFSSVSPLFASRTPAKYAEVRRLMHSVLVVVLPLFMGRKLSILNEKRVFEDKLKRFKYGGLYEGMRLAMNCLFHLSYSCAVDFGGRYLGLAGRLQVRRGTEILLYRLAFL